MANLRPRGATEYLKVFWHQKLLIFVIMAATLIAAVLVINRIPNIYESRALVVVSSDDRQASSVQISAVIQQLTSRSNLEASIRRYLLYRAIPNRDLAVERMRKDIQIETRMRKYYPDFPESYLISYRYTDPQMAKQVMSDLVSLFDKANEAMKQQAADEASQLSAKIAEVENWLSQLGHQRAGGREASDLDPIRSQRLAIISAIETLTDKQYALERQISEQQRQIAEQQQLVKLPQPTNGPRAGGAYGVLLVRKAEIEAQLKDYATQFTDKNPKVAQARTQLAEINRQIDKLETGSEQHGAAPGSSEARELHTLQRDLVRLETELEITRRELARKQEALQTLPKITAGRTVAATTEQSKTAGADLEAKTADAIDVKAGYDRLLNRYNSLLDKQDALQKLRAGAAGLGLSLFQIVDSPSLPQLPMAPNRRMLKLLALALALGLGLSVAAAIEIPRLFLIHDDRDVEYFLGAPAIALIPETLTPAERGRQRRLRFARGLGLALIAAALVPALVTLLNSLQIFQMLANR